MKRIFTLIAFIVVLFSVRWSVAKDDAQPSAAELQAKAIELLTEQTKERVKSLPKENRNLSGPFRIELAQKVAAAKKGKALLVPLVPPEKMEVGQVCFPDALQMTLVEIKSDSSAVVSVLRVSSGSVGGQSTGSRRDERTFLLEGFPTAKLTTDKPINFTEVDPPVIYFYGSVKNRGSQILKGIVINPPEKMGFTSY